MGVYSFEKRASFSCCALMNASLNKLASTIKVSNRLMTGLCGKAVKTILTFTVGKADGKCLRLRFSLTDIGCGVPNPTPVTANVWG